MAASASSRGTRKNRMGTSLSNSGGAARRRVAVGVVDFATETLPSGHDANVSDAMLCDPPVSNPTAEEEENAKERVDPAGLSQENAAGWFPPTSDCNPGSVFNDVSGEVPSDFTNFAVSLQTTLPVEGGENNIQVFRTSDVIDIISYLEEKKSEIRREAAHHMELLHTFYRSQIALQTDKHQQQVTEFESRSMSEKQELSSSLEGVSKELRDARAEVSSTESRLFMAKSELQDRNKLVHMMQRELGEMKSKNGALIKSREICLQDMNAIETDLENKLNLSQEAEKRKDRDVHRLIDVLQEKDKAIEEMQLSFLSQTALLTEKHQQQVTELESRAMSKIQELSSSLEGVAEELSDARAEVSSTKSKLSTVESELQDRNKLLQKMQQELADVKSRNNALIKGGEIFQEDMNAKKLDLEIKLSHSQEVENRKDRDVRRLNGLLQEKVKAIEEMQSARNLLTSECEKLKVQLAAMELKSTQESLTSGPYADDKWILIE